MNPMKEEYLEIEEIDCETASYKHLLEQNPLDVQVQDQNDHSKLTIHTDAHDDFMLKKLLNKFQMNFVYQFLKDADITYRSLRYLSVDDINAAIHSIGYRAEFREKLFAWRRKKFYTNDVIIESEPTDDDSNNRIFSFTSTPISPTLAKEVKKSKFNRLQPLYTNYSNKAIQLPQNIDYQVCAGTSETSIDNGSNKKMKLLGKNIDVYGRTLESLNIEKLLNESLFASVIKEFYEKHKYLERKHRDVLILTIVDYVIANGIKLRCSDFSKITEMIVRAFPCERDSRDYYFIARQGKRNPMGRLYTKYYNSLKTYRLRKAQSIEDTETSPSRPTTTAASSTSKMESLSASIAVQNTGKLRNSADHEFELPDEDNCEDSVKFEHEATDSIKKLLRCNNMDWSDIKVMWSKSYATRYNDILRLPTKTTLKHWPKYLNKNGVELFNIDFQMKYTGSREILLKKWQHFETMIFKYYKNHIKCNGCVKYFNLYQSKPGKDVENYITTVLLNAILVPTARYRDGRGSYRQISIMDAMELFAFRLNNLNELQKKHEYIAEKYTDLQMDMCPKIILVGDIYTSIPQIYVQFQTALYEMSDFLNALDTCMKIFRVLNLSYPNVNVLPWTFIQQYFYEIRLNNDVDHALMDSLIMYLKL